MSIPQTEEMTSAFKSPDPKRPLSARIRGSVLAKLRAVVDIWQETSKARGEEEAAGEVDLTYVVDQLLAKAADEELAQWGGFPDTDAKMAAVLKAVRAASKQ